MARGKTYGRHRSHATDKRVFRVMARFGEAEMAAVSSAAAEAGLKPGAWIAKVAVDVARRTIDDDQVGRPEQS